MVSVVKPSSPSSLLCPRYNHFFVHASVLGCQSARENHTLETRRKHSPPMGSQRLEPFPPQPEWRENRASHVHRRQVNTAGLACNLSISRARSVRGVERGREKKVLISPLFPLRQECQSAVWAKKEEKVDSKQRSDSL